MLQQSRVDWAKWRTAWKKREGQTLVTLTEKWGRKRFFSFAVTVFPIRAQRGMAVNGYCWRNVWTILNITAVQSKIFHYVLYRLAGVRGARGCVNGQISAQWTIIHIPATILSKAFWKLAPDARGRENKSPNEPIWLSTIHPAESGLHRHRHQRPLW